MKIRSVNSVSWESMKPPNMIKATNIDTIFGTNASVCSFICVVACMTDIIKPTTSPMTSIGAAVINIVYTPSCMTVIISAWESMALTSFSNPEPYILTPAAYPTPILKSRTNCWTIISHPSTTTNISTLNGMDMTTGGSIIMPIAIRTDATIISTTMNGR